MSNLAAVVLLYLCCSAYALRTIPFQGYRKFSQKSNPNANHGFVHPSSWNKPRSPIKNGATSWNTGCASDHPPPVAQLPNPLPSWFLEQLDQLDANISALVASEGTTSLMVNIVYDQQIIWQKGYGLVNLSDPNSAPTGDTIYRIGSITKAFTTLEALQLQDQGLIDMDDEVTKYYPEFQMPNPFFATQPITLELLTSHMAGLPRETPCINMFQQGCNTSTQELLLRMNTELQLILPPGLNPSYSNLGFGLLGRALETPTGMSWEDFFPKFVLDALQMENSGANITPDILARMPPGYTGVAGSGQIAPTLDIGWESPAGQLYSTTNDLAQFMMMIFQYDWESDFTFLDPQTIREWLEPVHFFGDGTAMGRPWEMYPVGNYMFHSKSGSLPGFFAEFVFSAPTKTGTVLLQSDDFSTTIFIAQELVSNFIATSMDTLLQELYMPPTIPNNFPEYVGEYNFVGVGNLTVYIGEVNGYGNALLLNGLSELGVVQLNAISQDSFMMSYGPLTHMCGYEWSGLLEIIQFLRDQNGDVISATIPGLAYGLIGNKWK